MNVLRLVLKKKWFDMIASGEKTEEYREIKRHWVSRICDDHEGCLGGDFMDAHVVMAYAFKKFDKVEFINGYRSDSPRIIKHCEGVEIGTGVPQWGAEQDKLYFVIKLS